MAKCENCYHFHMCDLQDRLEDYQDCKHFKDKSLILELPCKVGDVIYVIPSKTNYRLNKLNGFERHNRVHEQKVSEVHLYGNNGYLVKTCAGVCSALSEAFNKNWFMTYKEAEKALKEYENEM